jgi:hypothetical protein
MDIHYFEPVQFMALLLHDHDIVMEHFACHPQERRKRTTVEKNV